MVGRDLPGARPNRSFGNQRLSQPGTVQRRLLNAAVGTGDSTGGKVAGIQGAASSAERLPAPSQESAPASETDHQTRSAGRRSARVGGSASSPVKRAGISSA